MLLLSVFLRQQASRSQTTVSPDGRQTSSGGIYTVQGVLGPAQGATMSGGTYSIEQGLLTLIVETTGAPTMKIQVQGTDLVISWSGPVNAFNLERTTAIGSPWTTVSAAQQTSNGDVKVVIPFGPQNQFLRLKSANP